MTVSRQQTYYRVYRNRQSFLHHLAYVRLSKVYGVLHALKRGNLGLEGKRLFDYGFGAGTLFLHCPKNAQLFGVELDPGHVARLTETLSAKGYHAALEPIEEENWHDHAMLKGQYDIVVASHVLEHVKAPEELLHRLIGCVSPDGVVVLLLPINERIRHECHECEIHDNTVDAWAQAAGAQVIDRFQFDPFTYCAWPILEARSRPGRIAAQATSLTLGIAAAFIGPRAWMSLGRFCQHFAKPAQAAYVLVAGGLRRVAADSPEHDKSALSEDANCFHGSGVPAASSRS